MQKHCKRKPKHDKILLGFIFFGVHLDLCRYNCQYHSQLFGWKDAVDEKNDLSSKRASHEVVYVFCHLSVVAMSVFTLQCKRDVCQCQKLVKFQSNN